MKFTSSQHAALLGAIDHLRRAESAARCVPERERTVATLRAELELLETLRDMAEIESADVCTPAALSATPARGAA